MLNYDEALKKIRSKKTKDNLMVIKLSWDKRIILPFAAGVAFLATLQNAEILEEPYNKSPVIKGPDKDNFESSVMSFDYYEDIKVASLLNVTLEEVQKSKNPIPETA